MEMRFTSKLVVILFESLRLKEKHQLFSRARGTQAHVAIYFNFDSIQFIEFKFVSFF